ncbi:MAG: cytochrome c-type biogenesis CcmF C-terminal domain-containing protein [Candidatus Eisenbacteria bacterium]
MLKIWNMVLILSTFVLTVMGTFITRSGLISSVHSFAQSNIGYYFAGFLLASIVVSVGLIVWRRNDLKSQHHLDSYLSRESAFLFGNLILLGGAFAVLWGTLFPMFTEAIKGNRISLGPPFFNQFMIPVGLGILFLMGVGPLIPWRRASWRGLTKVFTVPTGLLLAAVAVLLVFGVTHAYALVTFGFCAFVTGTIVTEFKRGIEARMRSQGENPIVAFFRLFSKGQRRYGGYIVHLGVVIIFIGFAGSAFTQESETTLGRGETWHFRNYALTYRGLAVEQTPSVERISADVLLAHNDQNVAVMKPRKDWYQKNQQLASEVAIHATLGADLYLILASFDEKTDRASLKLYWNPLVSWYWIGGLVMVLGGLLVLLPLRRRQLT